MAATLTNLQSTGEQGHISGLHLAAWKGILKNETSERPVTVYVHSICPEGVMPNLEPCNAATEIRLEALKAAVGTRLRELLVPSLN